MGEQHDVDRSEHALRAAESAVERDEHALRAAGRTVRQDEQAGRAAAGCVVTAATGSSRSGAFATVPMVRRSSLPESVAARVGYQRLCDFVFSSFEGLIPYDRVALGLLEDDGTTIWLAGATSTQPDLWALPGSRGRIDRGTLSTVLATMRPRILNDLVSYAREHRYPSQTQALVDDGYAASLTAPLCVGEQNLGFLFFNSRTADTYQPEHAETIRRIARAVSAVVAEIGRLGNTDAAWANVLGSSLPALVRSAREVHEEEAFVARVVDLVDRGTTLAQLLDAVYESFTALLPFDRISFATIDSERRTVSTRWARAKGPLRLGSGYTQPLAATTLPLVSESNAPRIIDDLEKYLELNPASASTRLLVEEGMRSSMTYFLGTPGHPVGFLFFNSKTAGAYGLRHVARLRKLTERLTAAFQRAILFDRVEEAQRRTEQLLHQLVPPAIARRVEAGERDVVERLDATAIMCDLVGFSTWSAQLTPLELFRSMTAIFRAFDECAKKHDVLRIRTMGDGYFAVAGVPTARPDHAIAAARMALDMAQVLRRTRRPDGGPMLARIGLHSGPVVAGVAGGADLQYEVWGKTVTVAARMESASEAGRIQVSQATADLLAGHFRVEPRGPVELKGIGIYETCWLLDPETSEASEQ